MPWIALFQLIVFLAVLLAITRVLGA